MSNDDRKIFLTVVGPEDVIQSLSAIKGGEGFRVGAAQPVDGLADAVDSVLGPDEIKQLLEFATVVLEFGAAATTFISTLKELLASSPATEKQQIRVLDARTNVEIVLVDERTNEAAARKTIESSAGK